MELSFIKSNEWHLNSAERFWGQKSLNLAMISQTVFLLNDMSNKNRPWLMELAKYKLSLEHHTVSASYLEHTFSCQNEAKKPARDIIK